MTDTPPPVAWECAERCTIEAMTTFHVHRHSSPYTNKRPEYFQQELQYHASKLYLLGYTEHKHVHISTVTSFISCICHTQIHKCTPNYYFSLYLTSCINGFPMYYKPNIKTILKQKFLTYPLIHHSCCYPSAHLP